MCALRSPRSSAPAGARQPRFDLRLRSLCHSVQRGRTRNRRVPRRIRLIRDFHAPDQLWEDLSIPIDMAYFYQDSVAGRAKASIRVRRAPPNRCWRWPRGGNWRHNPILTRWRRMSKRLLANRLGHARERRGGVFPVADR